MRDYLTHSRLFANYSDNTEEIYRSAVAEPFNNLERKVHEEVQRVVRDIQVVVASDGEAPEAEQAHVLAAKLRSGLESAQVTVKSAQDVLRELAPL
jgi:hypothetical protein